MSFVQFPNVVAITAAVKGVKASLDEKAEDQCVVVTTKKSIRGIVVADFT